MTLKLKSNNSKVRFNRSNVTNFASIRNNGDRSHMMNKVEKFEKNKQERKTTAPRDS